METGILGYPQKPVYKKSNKVKGKEEAAQLVEEAGRRSDLLCRSILVARPTRMRQDAAAGITGWSSLDARWLAEPSKPSPGESYYC